MLQENVSRAETVASVADASLRDGRVAAQHLFGYCPELLAEVGAAPDLPVHIRGCADAAAS